VNTDENEELDAGTTGNAVLPCQPAGEELNRWPWLESGV
jgi:hypothetical protein